jgi:pimeloyl-ACP methyl ester carboxylesterase
MTPVLVRYLRFLPGPFKLVFRRYSDSPEERQRLMADIIRLTEARSLPLDDEWVRQTAAEALRRHSLDGHARTRQFAAGRGAKLPGGGIARITQPVLVIGGDEDQLVRAPAAGQALAYAVPHGRFVLVHRIGAPALGSTVVATGQRDQPARHLTRMMTASQRNHHSGPECSTIRGGCAGSPRLVT